MTEESVEDRCRGMLLGLAAEDCNGGPIRMAWLRNSGRLRIVLGLCESLQPGPDGMGSFLLCNKPGGWFFAGAFFQNEGVPEEFLALYGGSRNGEFLKSKQGRLGMEPSVL
jgi:hypothetical protein